MSKSEVLVMYPARPDSMAQLEALYTLHRYDEAEDKDALLAEVGPRCVAIATNGHAPLTRAHLEHLPNVRIVACSSAGFESIDIDALKERGIWFTNTSVALCDDVADTALMMTLAVRRQLVAADAYVRTGEWGRKGMYPLMSAMSGKRAGIVGLGQIGLATARRFEPLGLEIGYMTRSRKPVDYRYFDDVVALAEWADILVAIVPGGPETEKMIDAKVLKALGPKGSFVNVSRGTVVDEAALLDALRNGTIASAALDVFMNEPNPDPELVALPNITLYPHHASGTVETRDAMSQLVVDNIAAYLSGKPLLTPVYDLPA